MKKLFLLLILFVMLFILSDIALANDFTVALSTYDVVGSTTDFTAGGYPNVAAGLKISKLSFANQGAQLQVISCYDTATSTAAASLCLVVVVPSSSTVQVDYSFLDRLKVRNFAGKKSSAASAVQMNVQFK